MGSKDMYVISYGCLCSRFYVKFSKSKDPDLFFRNAIFHVSYKMSTHLFWRRISSGFLCSLGLLYIPGNMFSNANYSTR